MRIKKIIAAAAAFTVSCSFVPLTGNIALKSVLTAIAADTAAVKLLPSLDVLGSSNATFYSNTQNAAFSMDGRAYYQGVVLGTSTLNTSAYVTFDVSALDSFSCTIGHVDNENYYDVKLKVYLDGVCVDTMTLSYRMMAQKYSDLDVSDSSELKFVFEGSSCKYAIGDISTNKESPDNPSVAPVYKNVSNLLENRFNSDSISVYSGTSRNSGFNMNGRTYYQGIIFNTSVIDSYSSVSFNVENLSKLSWTLGHVDGEENSKATMKVYIDDDEQSDTRALSWNMELEEYELDIPEGSKVVRIEVPSSSVKYAIADIKADSLDAGEEHIVPKYIKASTFIDSGFNNTRITKYTGSSKGNKYNVNGRTYYQGIVFNADVISTYGSINYNVENLSHMSFSVGRIQNAGTANATLYIYRDNEECMSIEMKPYMQIADYEIDLKDTKNLRFKFSSDGQCVCALMNIHVDKLAPEIDYLTPKYDKISKCVESVFDTDSVTTYNGSSKGDIFRINGRTYYEGIKFSSTIIDSVARASLNVEDIDTISWTLGHVDNSGLNSGKLYVYLDEELIKTIDLNWGMRATDYSFDVKEGTVMRFYYNVSGASAFALADIKADSRATEIAHIVPEYENASEFLSSNFNNSSITVYNGESPKTNKFTMNDKEYTQGFFCRSTSILGNAGNVAFNTENVKSIKFKYGHIDGPGDGNATLTIYKDSNESEKIKLVPDMETQEMSIDTSDAEYIYFYMNIDRSGAYALADLGFVPGDSSSASTTTTTAKAATTTTSATTTKATTTTKPAATTTVTTTTSSATTTTVKPVDYTLGDVDKNGIVDAVDASRVLAYYARISTKQDGGFDDSQKQAADVNKDGIIDAVDASKILSYYAYLSTTKEKTVSMEEFMKKSSK
ncbi:dockerin type I domain-containing protein [uncultured Ruminococcus sp.]|uniref:dockerin type I domain-containing protein n=1 Tax=uncultured Ruminococcus sp. TaxID=165186 RepID=UPI0025E7EC6C|nr:dockerin type I domain-containing protein [uncultured Ruminococcus sp.]